MTKILSKLYTVLAAAFLVFGLSQAASATVLNTTLEFSFGNGSCGGPGNTTTCVITVQIADTGANQVTMTIAATNLNGGFISDFYFNTNPYEGTLSIFSTNTGGDSIAAPGLTNSMDSLQADGDGKFDHQLAFQQSNAGGNRFNDGESIVIVFTGTSLTADDFNDNSIRGGGQGVFCLAAHVQGTGNDNQDSDWLAGSCEGTPVPEPSSLLLFGAGLLALGAVTRRRRKIA